MDTEPRLLKLTTIVIVETRTDVHSIPPLLSPLMINLHWVVMDNSMGN